MITFEQQSSLLLVKMHSIFTFLESTGHQSQRIALALKARNSEFNTNVDLSLSKTSVHSRRNNSRQAILIPRQLHTVQWLQTVKPNSLRIVLCKERTSNPALVSTLKETKYKCLLSHNLFDSSNFHFTGSTRHGRTTSGTDEA